MDDVHRDEAHGPTSLIRHPKAKLKILHFLGRSLFYMNVYIQVRYKPAHFQHVHELWDSNACNKIYIYHEAYGMTVCNRLSCNQCFRGSKLATLSSVIT